MSSHPELKTIATGEGVYETRLTRKYESRRPYEPPDRSKLHCVIPGVICRVAVVPGQSVVRGTSLLILEAMKMQNDVLSPVDGVVKLIHVTPGQMVARGQTLIEFE
jgi:glutaconyl-CoA/methylmalonyl-CoA decarboxylase subunit gamma